MQKTMKLHGKVVRLVDVKAALKYHNRTQAQVAEALGVTQGNISHYLCGRVPPTEEFRLYVEALVTPAQAEKLNDRFNRSASGSTTGSFPQGGKTAAPPVSAAGQQQAAQAGKGQITHPAPETADNDPPVLQAADFPAADAWKVLELARKAHQAGHVSYCPSFRTIQRWGWGYVTLRRAGYGHEDALIGSHDLVVRQKTEPGGEDRKFSEESFRTVFGLPADLALPPLDEYPDEHPSFSLALPFGATGKPLWFHGVKGSGKSHAARSVANTLGRGFIEVDGKGDMTSDEFIGTLGARGGETVAHYGALPVCMKRGEILIINEISAIPAEILMALHNVLEGQPLTLTGMGEVEVVDAAEGFGVIVTDNTVGLGEGIGYAGTRAMNDAFRDRFFFVEFPEMPKDQVLRLAREDLEGFISEQGFDKP